MSVWFSGSAVVPQLASAWGLDRSGQAWMTMAVQVGFVAGALAGAFLNLADRVSVPLALGRRGWRWAFAPLALGPAAGCVAMLRLRALPQARRLASGRR